MRALLSRLGDFLESRAGLRTLGRHALDEPIPGGPRWLYVPGSLLSLFLGLQLLTGVVLALHFSPAAATAWASIVHLEEKVPGGAIVRGLHAWGASAIVLGLVLHYGAVAWVGAYRKPRELNWALGLVLAAVILALCHTGYQLPWDQKGYWATKVATGIAGSTPGVGPGVQSLVRGGSDYGNLTLSRFFVAHVVVLPAALLALVLAHVALFRRHGVTTPASVPPGAPAARFFPRQVLRDAVAFLVGFGLLYGLVLATGRAPLAAPGDPASDYPPRPEWYFRPLYQLLRYFPSSLEFVGAQVIPGLLFLGLLALPRLDRSPTRDPKARKVALALAFAPLAVAIGLGVLSALHDAGDERFLAARRLADRDASLARRLFLEQGGVPPEGPLALLDRYPPRLGRRLFREHCLGCHALEGTPLGKGPELTGYLSPRWLEGVIRDPTEPRYFGHPEFKESMGKTEATPAELAALVLYVRSLEGVGATGSAAAPSFPPERVAEAKAVYEAKQCGTCHETTPGETSDEGPNLAGYGSAEWLRAFLEKPGAKRFYGKQNKMPAYAGKLSREDLDALVLFLRALAKGVPDEE